MHPRLVFIRVVPSSEHLIGFFVDEFYEAGTGVFFDFLAIFADEDGVVIVEGVFKVAYWGELVSDDNRASKEWAWRGDAR